LTYNDIPSSFLGDEYADGISPYDRYPEQEAANMEEKALIIGAGTVRRYFSEDDAIGIVEDVWQWYGEGKIAMPSKITTDMSPLGVDGWFNSMPSYIQPCGAAGLKLVGGYGGNRALGLPYIKANVVITEPATGRLLALVAGDHISNLRTGAQPAVAARLLHPQAHIVTIIGAGSQGTMCLACMEKALSLREVRVCDILPDARARFIDRFPENPYRLIDCASNEEGCRDSDIIITITTADAPLIEMAWVKPGAVVFTMCSFTEVADDVVLQADLLGADHVGQSLHRGNLKTFAERGYVTAESIKLVLPDILAGKIPYTYDPGKRAVVQLVGMGAPDLAAAKLVYDRVHSDGCRDVGVFDMNA